MPNKHKNTDEVTDPALLAQLNASSEKEEVTDPAILAQLNGETTPQKKSPDQTTSAANLPSSPGGGSQGGDLNLTPTDPITGIPTPTQTQAQASPQEVDPRQQTADAANVLAGHIVKEAQESPVKEYVDNINTIPFTQPGSIVHDATNPHGDPQTTGDYAKYAVEKLNLQKSQELQKLAAGGGPNVDPDYQKEAQEISDRYDKQIAEMHNAAHVLISQQQINRDIATKKLLPKEAAKSAWDVVQSRAAAIENAKSPEDMQKAEDDSKTQLDAINGNTKYDALKLGIEQQKLLGNKSAEGDLAKLQSGQPIPDDRRVQYQSIGYDAIQLAAKNAKANGNDEAAQEMEDHSSDPQKRLEEDNPKYFGKQYANQIGDYVYNNVDNPIYGTLFSRPQLTEEEKQKYGKAAGLTKDQLALVKAEDVPTASSIYGQALQGAADAFTFDNSKGDGFFTGKVPQAQQGFGNPRAIIGEIAGGAGTVAGFMAQGGIIGEGLKGAEILGDAALNAKRYQTASNMIPLALSNYANAYEQSKQVIGDKPEDGLKRQSYAILNGVLSTALMSIDPATKLTSEAIFKTPAGEQFINATIKKGLENVAPEQFESKLQTFLKKLPEQVGATGEHVATQAGIMGGAKIASNITDMLYDPEHRHSVMDNVGNAAIGGGISMFIPSLLHGMHVTDNPINKALVWDIGNKPKEYNALVDEQQANGTLTADQAKQAKDFIWKTQTTVSSRVPETNVLNNKALLPEQRQAYTWNLLRNDDLNKKLDALNAQDNPDKSQVQLISSRLNDLAKERTDILNNAGLSPAQVKAQPRQETVQDIGKELADLHRKDAHDHGTWTDDDKNQNDFIKTNPEQVINDRIETLSSLLEETPDSKYFKKELAKTQEYKTRLDAAQERQNKAQNAQGSVATDGEGSAQPATKKNNTENKEISKEPLPLSSQGESQTKSTENEKGNGSINDEEGRQNGSKDDEGQVVRPNTEIQAAASGELPGQQEDRKLKPSEKGTKAGESTESPAKTVLSKEELEAPAAPVRRKNKGAEAPKVIELPIPVQVEPKLQTQDNGEAKGQSEAATEEKLQEAAREHPDKPVDYLFAGKDATGEPTDKFIGRIKGAMNEIDSDPEKYPDNSIVVTHSTVLKLIQAAQDLGEKGKPDFDHGNLINKHQDQSTEPGDMIEYKTPDGRTIHISRHGEAESNLKDEQRTDGTKLTEQGRKDAIEIADKLKEKGVAPSKIITSDLPRAKETAGIISGEFKSNQENEGLDPKISEIENRRAIQLDRSIVRQEHNRKFTGWTAIYKDASGKIAGEAEFKSESTGEKQAQDWLNAKFDAEIKTVNQERPKESDKPNGAIAPEANKEQGGLTKKEETQPLKIDGQTVFYHASDRKREGRLNPGHAPQFGEAVYFGSDKEGVHGEYGDKNTTQAELHLDNPLYTNTPEYKKVEDAAKQKYWDENIVWDEGKDDYWDKKKGRPSSSVRASDLEIGDDVPVKYLNQAAKDAGYDAFIDQQHPTYGNEIAVLDESKIKYPEDAKIKEENQEPQVEPEKKEKPAKPLTKEQQKLSSEAKLKYNTLRKVPSKQGDMIRSAAKRIETLKERIAKYDQKKVPKTNDVYRSAINELAVKQDFIEHTKQFPPKDVGKTGMEAGHMERVAKVIKESKNSISVEEDVMAAMLKMDDHNPETKWNISSLGNLETFKKNAKESEKDSAVRYTHKDGKISIDKWASGMGGDDDKQREYKEEAERLIREYPSKVDLAKALEKIQEDRIKAAEEPEDAQAREEWERQQAQEMNEAQVHAGVADEDFKNKEEGEPGVAAGQEDIQKINEADLPDEDKQKIEEYYRKYYDEKTGEVDYDHAHMDYAALENLKKTLSDKGKSLMDDILPFDNFEQHNKQVQKLIKDAADYEKQQREAGIPQEGEPERELAPEGGGAPPDVQDKATEEAAKPAGKSEAELAEPTPEEVKAGEKLNQAPNDERSVATDAKSKDGTSAPKGKPLEDEEKLAGHKKVLQTLISKGKEAEKERLAAIKSGDNERIAEATKNANDIKDMVLKKQKKIAELEEDIATKKIYKDKGAEVAKNIDANAEKRKGDVRMGPDMPWLEEKVHNFLRDSIEKAIGEVGNVHVGIRRAIRWTKEKFGDLAKALTYEHVDVIRDASRDKYSEYYPKDEPSLSIDHEEYVKDILADIRSGKMSYEEARKEIDEEEILNRAGQQVSDHVSENIKADYMKYLDWHIQNDFTNIKNETTRLRRKQYNLADEMPSLKKTFGDTLEEAKEQIANGLNPSDLVDELHRNMEKNPRPHTHVEVAIMAIHGRKLDNDMSDIQKKIKKANEDGDKAALAEAITARAVVEDQWQKLADVAKSTGREAGLALNARKLTVDQRYDLVNMISEKKSSANDGKDLSEEQRAHIEELHQRIKDTQEAADAYMKQKQAEFDEKTLKLQRQLLAARQEGGQNKPSGASDPKNKPGPGSSSLEKSYSKSQNVAKKLRDWADNFENKNKGNVYSSPIPITPKMIADAVRLVAAGVEKGGDVLDWVQKSISKIKEENSGINEATLEKHINQALIDSGWAPPTEENKAKVKSIQYMTGFFKEGRYDKKLEELNVAANRAKDEFDTEIKKDQQKQRSWLSKAQNTFITWTRGIKLSSPITAAKIAVMGMSRLASNAADDIAGSAIGLVAPTLAKGALGEGGGINVAATARALRIGMTQGLKDSYQIMSKGSGGKSDLDVLYGKGGDLPPEAIEFFGKLHSAEKAPVKRAAFERAIERRLTNTLKNGGDANDPVVQTAILNGAYQDANRAIFMQDNKVSAWWQKNIRDFQKIDPETGESPEQWKATAMQFMIPFSKVPSNWVAETAKYVGGFPYGVGQLIHAKLTGSLESMPSDQKDVIMRNLKKGSIGLAAMSYGFFNPQNFGGYYHKGQKRDDDDADVDAYKIFGHKLPAWIGENPAMQAMQFGATVRRVMDHLLKGEKEGVVNGLGAATLGLIQHNPLIEQSLRFGSVFQGDAGAYTDELIKGTFVPAGVDYSAKVFDPADNRTLLEKMLYPQNKRKRPTNLEEHVESGIPGLRENLEKKHLTPEEQEQKLQEMESKLQNQ